MKLPRRNFLHLAAGAAVLPAASRIARAQAYPARPVRLLIGFAPGGTQDVIGRLLGQWLTERLGQQVIIENWPGAASNIAAEAAIRSVTWTMPSRCLGIVIGRLKIGRITQRLSCVIFLPHVRL
jgi:tripartite-type tricarboxylate transporter receptor subunit TctC